MIYVVGLGNPSEEYKETRHNSGFWALENFAKTNKFEDWTYDKKSNSNISKGKIGKESVVLIAPQTFMNKSGNAVSYFIKPKTGKNKSIQNLIVIYDDIDLALGTIKISYNKSSGGHRGLESIIKSVKTLEFARIRIGVAPSTPKGKLKKPSGEKPVLDFILGKWKANEREVLKKVLKTTTLAVETIITEGREMAMNRFN
jgi:PTH1 family peptidyl-tRNA hydrolase